MLSSRLEVSIAMSERLCFLVLRCFVVDQFVLSVSCRAFPVGEIRIIIIHFNNMIKVYMFCVLFPFWETFVSKRYFEPVLIIAGYGAWNRESLK